MKKSIINLWRREAGAGGEAKSCVCHAGCGAPGGDAGPALPLLDHFRSVSPSSNSSIRAGESLGLAQPEAAGGLRWWDPLSLGKVCAAAFLVLMENSLGAMMKLQVQFGFGELMVMARGRGLVRGDFGDAQQKRTQISLCDCTQELQEGMNKLGLLKGTHGGNCPGPSC